MGSHATSPSAAELSTPNLELREPTGSIVPHVLLCVVQLVALASPNFRGRRSFFVTAIIVLAIWSMIDPNFTNNTELARPFTLTWANYFSTLEKIMFAGANGPEGDLWHIDKPAQEALAYPAFGYRKLKWAIVIIINLRGIRWNYQVKNVPELKEKSKSAFLISKSVDLAYYMFMSDLFEHLGVRLFFTAPNGEVGALNSKFITLAHPDWRWGFIKILVLALTPYYLINMQYILYAIIAVALGISKPEDWPPNFGNLKEVTTIRHFWGVFWHQPLRKVLTTFTGAFVDAVGIRRGSTLSSYTQLWLAFLISALMHTQSFLILPSPTNITLSERTVGVVQFFLWQAAAITFEDFIQWFWARLGGKTTGPSVFRTVLGYVWVVWSFWYSVPLGADVWMRMRIGQEPFLPFTVAGPWMKYIPIP